MFQVHTKKLFALQEKFYPEPWRSRHQAPLHPPLDPSRCCRGTLVQFVYVDYTSICTYVYVKSVNPKMFGVLCKWPVVWIRMIYRNAVNNISQKTSGAKVLFTIMILAIKL